MVGKRKSANKKSSTKVTVTVKKGKRKPSVAQKHMEEARIIGPLMRFGPENRLGPKHKKRVQNRRKNMRKIAEINNPGLNRSGGLLPTLGASYASSHKTRDVPVTLEANELIVLQNGTGVGEITNDLQNQSFYINPANTELFPVFSGIAKNYSEFQLLDLKVDYVSTSSQLTTGGNSGTVYALINYDPTEDPLTEYTQIADFNPHMETVPYISDSLSLNVKGSGFRGSRGHDTKTVRKILNTANTALQSATFSPTSGSICDFHVGLLQLIAHSTPTISQIGEWRIRAKFVLSGLRKPNPADDELTIKIKGVNATTSAPLTGAQITSGGNEFNPVLSNLAVSLSDVPIGTKFSVNTLISGATSVASLSVVPVGASDTSYLQGDTSYSVTSGATTATLSNLSIFTSTANIVVFTLSPGTIVGSGVYIDMIISVLPTATLSVQREDEEVMEQRIMQRIMKKLQISTIFESDDEHMINECKTNSNTPQSGKKLP
jgi:hypothetical protein